MRLNFTPLILLVFSISKAYTQPTPAVEPQLVKQAIITTQISVISTDDSVNTSPKVIMGKHGKEVISVQTDDPAEMKSTTWYKEAMVRTEVEMGTKRVTTIRDNAAKKTTILTEESINTFSRTIISTFGYYIEDDQLEAFIKAMAAQTKDSAQTAPSVRIFYQDIEQEIANYPCRRAVVDVTDTQGNTERAIVWYNTLVKLEGLPVTGDPAYGYLYLQPNKKMDFFAQLKGFPMRYEMILSPGRTLVVEVLKLNIKKEIKDKVFRVPNTVKLVPLKLKIPA